MGPDPTLLKHTFDPQWIRGQPAFDPIQRDFFWMAKIEKFSIFRGNFPNPNPNKMADPTWPVQQKNWPDPSQKFLTRTHPCFSLRKLTLDIFFSVVKFPRLFADLRIAPSGLCLNFAEMKRSRHDEMILKNILKIFVLKHLLYYNRQPPRFQLKLALCRLKRHVVMYLSLFQPLSLLKSVWMFPRRFVLQSLSPGMLPEQPRDCLAPTNLLWTRLINPLHFNQLLLKNRYGIGFLGWLEIKLFEVVITLGSKIKRATFPLQCSIFFNKIGHQTTFFWSSCKNKKIDKGVLDGEQELYIHMEIDRTLKREVTKNGLRCQK